MKQCQFVEEGWGGYDFVLSKNRSPQNLLPSKFVTNGIDVDHARFYCFVPHLVRSSFMIASGVFKYLHCPLYCQQQLTQSSFLLFGRLLLLEMRQLQTHHWIEQEAVSVASFENTFSCVQLQPNWCVACHLKVYNSLVQSIQVQVSLVQSFSLAQCGLLESSIVKSGVVQVSLVHFSLVQSCQGFVLLVSVQNVADRFKYYQGLKVPY